MFQKRSTLVTNHEKQYFVLSLQSSVPPPVESGFYRPTLLSDHLVIFARNPFPLSCESPMCHLQRITHCNNTVTAMTLNSCLYLSSAKNIPPSHDLFFLFPLFNGNRLHYHCLFLTVFDVVFVPTTVSSFSSSLETLRPTICSRLLPSCQAEGSEAVAGERGKV